MTDSYHLACTTCSFACDVEGLSAALDAEEEHVAEAGEAHLVEIERTESDPLAHQGRTD